MMPRNPGTCTTCGGAILYRPDERTECVRCSGLGPLVHRGGELLDRGGTWSARAGGEVVHVETEHGADKTARYPAAKRVQITWRHAGGERPANVRSVARPTRWGNPYPVAEHGRDEAIRLFRQYLVEHPELVAAARRELTGHDLACYCGPDEPCHGDVWLEVLDSVESR